MSAQPDEFLEDITGPRADVTVPPHLVPNLNAQPEEYLVGDETLPDPELAVLPFAVPADDDDDDLEVTQPPCGRGYDVKKDPDSEVARLLPGVDLGEEDDDEDDRTLPPPDVAAVFADTLDLDVSGGGSETALHVDFDVTGGEDVTLPPAGDNDLLQPVVVVEAFADAPAATLVSAVPDESLIDRLGERLRAIHAAQTTVLDVPESETDISIPKSMCIPDDMRRARTAVPTERVFKTAASEVGFWKRARNFLAKPEVADAVVGGFFGAGARIGVKFLFAAKLATLPFIAASPVAAGIAAVVIAGAIGGLVSNACHRNRKKGSWRRAMLFGAAGGFIGGWIADSLYHPSVVETAKATVHPVANYSVEQAFNAAQAPLADFSGAINPPDVSVGLTDIELPSMPDGSTFAVTNFADSIPGVDASTISDGPHAIVDTVPPVETVPTASTSQLDNIMQAAADAKAAGDIATLEKLVAGMKESSFQLINGEGATLQSKMAGAFMLEQANTIVQENNLHSASAYMVERDYKIVSGWGWSNKARAVFALH